MQANLLAFAGMPSFEIEVARMACEAFGQPLEKSAECLARVYGLQGAGSLRPWTEEGVTDTAALARRDYEPQHGEAWPEEWARRRDDAFFMLEMRFGEGWPGILADRIAAGGA